VIGHDVGASIAFTLATAHQDQVSALVLMEAFPAGLELASGQQQTWHLGFMGRPDLPETLLAGREQAFPDVSLSADAA
jgi:pimeloyl-ACP methyl ester carboxylesterase